MKQKSKHCPADAAAAGKLCQVLTDSSQRCSAQLSSPESIPVLPIHALVVHLGSLVVSDGPGMLMHGPL